MGPVEHLRALVSMDTTSHRSVAPVSAHMAEHLESLGFRIEHFGTADKHNVVASMGPPGTDGLVLSGHMDVVPTENQPWTSDPFTLTERGDRLIARGSADMKGFLAATLTALHRIGSAPFKRELVLVWTHDEEVGCLGSSLLVEALLDDGRPLPRACVIGEPTGFRMLRMHPGHVASEFTFHGAAAHSSRPDLGINAIEAAADAIVAIRQLAKELESERAFEGILERPWVAVNTATLHAGSAINIVPDKAVVQLGYRPLPGMDAHDVHTRIVERVRQLPDMPRFDDRVLRVTPAMLTAEDSVTLPLVSPHACEQQQGAASFATDGGNLAKLGMQPIVWGPGAIEVAHQADEYISRSELVRSVDMVEAMIRTRCL